MKGPVTNTDAPAPPHGATRSAAARQRRTAESSAQTTKTEKWSGSLSQGPTAASSARLATDAWAAASASLTRASTRTAAPAATADLTPTTAATSPPPPALKARVAAPSPAMLTTEAVRSRRARTRISSRRVAAPIRATGAVRTRQPHAPPRRALTKTSTPMSSSRRERSRTSRPTRVGGTLPATRETSASIPTPRMRTKAAGTPPSTPPTKTGSRRRAKTNRKSTRAPRRANSGERSASGRAST